MDHLLSMEKEEVIELMFCSVLRDLSSSLKTG